MSQATSITLPDDLDAWLRGEVAAGRAADASEIVTRALRDWRAYWSDHSALVAEANEQLRRGEGVDEADADAFIDKLIRAA